MAWTQGDLTKLEAAIAGGAQRVKYKDREVTYRSLDEMQRLRDQMRRDLGLITTPNRTVFQISKGT